MIVRFGLLIISVGGDRAPMNGRALAARQRAGAAARPERPVEQVRIALRSIRWGWWTGRGWSLDVEDARAFPTTRAARIAVRTFRLPSALVAPTVWHPAE